MRTWLPVLMLVCMAGFRNEKRPPPAPQPLPFVDNDEHLSKTSDCLTTYEQGSLRSQVHA
jgi:hypothetical protein